MKKFVVSIYPYDDGCIGTHDIELHISELHEKFIIKTADFFKNYAGWFENNEPKFSKLEDYESFGCPLSIEVYLPIAKWNLDEYGINTTIVNINANGFYVSSHTVCSNILLESSFVKLDELMACRTNN